MNRKQKRQKEKQISKEKLFTATEVKQIQIDAHQKAIMGITRELFNIMLYQLNSTYGFGYVRSTRLLDSMYDLFDSIDKGYVSLEDIKKFVKDELKIEIR